jgi:hypothetical protein
VPASDGASSRQRRRSACHMSNVTLRDQLGCR